jgi:hypothetical protein
MSIERRAFLRLAGGTAIAAGLGGGIAEYAATFEPNNLFVRRINGEAGVIFTTLTK